MRIVRKGVLSTLDEQLHESRSRDESAVQITSEKLKVAAKKIFNSVAKRGSDWVPFTYSVICCLKLKISFLH